MIIIKIVAVQDDIEWVRSADKIMVNQTNNTFAAGSSARATVGITIIDCLQRKRERESER